MTADPRPARIAETEMTLQTWSSARPPKAAWWLGGLGLLPFLALCVVVCVAVEDAAKAATGALVAYAAVILSFIGGAHWGFASKRLGDDPVPAAGGLLALSVLPSLLGWLSLLLPMPWPLALLAVGFAAVLILDRWAASIAFAPRWWMGLRRPLSTAVAMVLLMALMAAILRFGASAYEGRPAILSW